MVLEIDLVIISASDLKRVTHFSHQVCYAVAYIQSGEKQVTRVDHDGGTNPTWNSKLVLTCEESLLKRPGSCITVEIYSHRSFNTKIVGISTIPLVDVAREAKDKVKLMAFEVRRPSGRVNGVLNLSVRLGATKTVQSGMGKQSTGKQSSSVPSSEAYSYVQDYKRQQQQRQEAPPKGYPQTDSHTSYTSKFDVPVAYHPTQSNSSATSVYPPPKVSSGSATSVYPPPRKGSDNNTSTPGEPVAAYPPTDIPTAYPAQQYGQQFPPQYGKQYPQQMDPASQPNAPYNYQQAYYSKPPKRQGGRSGAGLGLLGGALGGLLLGDIIGGGDFGGGDFGGGDFGGF